MDIAGAVVVVLPEPIPSKSIDDVPLDELCLIEMVALLLPELVGRKEALMVQVALTATVLQALL